MIGALGPGAADRIELRVHLPLEPDIRGIMRVVGAEPLPLPHQVGGDARPCHGDPVPVACPGPAVAVRCALRVRVARVGICRHEAVAEDPGRPVRDDRAVATPAGSVDRVMGVDVDESSVAVGWRPPAGRSEAPDAGAFVRVLAEDLLEPIAREPVSGRRGAPRAALSSVRGEATTFPVVRATGRSRGRAARSASSEVPSTSRPEPGRRSRTRRERDRRTVGRRCGRSSTRACETPPNRPNNRA